MEQEVPQRLAELMERWAQLRTELDQVEEEIRSAVLAARRSFRHGNVIATFSSGRGQYDYQRIAQELQIPESVIARFTRTVVDWKGACEEVGIPAALKEQYYTPGVPFVTIRFA